VVPRRESSSRSPDSVLSASTAATQSDAAWAAAQGAHETAPPDADFAELLRGTANAVSIEAAAPEYTITAGLNAKQPWPSAPQFAPKLGPGANRPGDQDLWEKWDQTVRDWQAAAQGTSIAQLARAFRLVAYARPCRECLSAERHRPRLGRESERRRLDPPQDVYLDALGSGSFACLTPRFGSLEREQARLVDCGGPNPT
jgi:hypothetical protein